MLYLVVEDWSNGERRVVAEKTDFVVAELYAERHLRGRIASQTDWDAERGSLLGVTIHIPPEGE